MKNLKRTVLIIILSTCFLNSSYSQGDSKKTGKDFTVAWGPDMKLKGLFPTDMLLYDKGSFYVSSMQPKFGGGSDFVLAKIDAHLDLVVQNKIKTEEANKKASYNHAIGLLEYGGQIYILEKEKVHHDKKLNFYFETINKETLMPGHDKKLVYSIDYSVDNNRDDDTVSFIIDKEKKFIVIYDEHYVNKKENAKATIAVLSNTFSNIWSRDVTLPVIATKSGTARFDKFIDDASDFYLVAKVYKEEKRNAKDIKDGELNYDFHIYMFGKNIDQFVDFPLNLKDKAISQLKLNVNKKGEIIAIGIYADIVGEKNRVSIPKGIFFTTIDPEKNNIISQSYKEFESEVYTAGMKESQVKKTEKRLEKDKDLGFTFLIRNLINRSDGGSTMIAEEYSEVTTESTWHNNMNNTGGVTMLKTSNVTTVCTYRNILIAKISSKGDIEWITVIPKVQVTEFTKNAYGVTSSYIYSSNLVTENIAYTFPSSFLLFENKNDSYTIFFNDSRENLSAANANKQEVKPMNNFYKSTLVFVEVNASGELTNRAEAAKLPPDEERTHFYPRLSFIPNESEIILFGTEKSHDKFARIHFDKK